MDSCQRNLSGGYITLLFSVAAGTEAGRQLLSDTGLWDHLARMGSQVSYLTSPRQIHISISAAHRMCLAVYIQGPADIYLRVKSRLPALRISYCSCTEGATRVVRAYEPPCFPCTYYQQPELDYMSRLILAKIDLASEKCFPRDQLESWMTTGSRYSSGSFAGSFFCSPEVHLFRVPCVCSTLRADDD